MLQSIKCLDSSYIRMLYDEYYSANFSGQVIILKIHFVSNKEQPPVSFLMSPFSELLEHSITPRDKHYHVQHMK